MDTSPSYFAMPLADMKYFPKLKKIMRIKDAQTVTQLLTRHTRAMGWGTLLSGSGLNIEYRYRPFENLNWILAVRIFQNWHFESSMGWIIAASTSEGSLEQQTWQVSRTCVIITYFYHEILSRTHNEFSKIFMHFRIGNAGLILFPLNWKNCTLWKDCLGDLPPAL